MQIKSSPNGQGRLPEFQDEFEFTAQNDDFRDGIDGEDSTPAPKPTPEEYKNLARYLVAAGDLGGWDKVWEWVDKMHLIHKTCEKSPVLKENVIRLLAGVKPVTQKNWLAREAGKPTRSAEVLTSRAVVKACGDLEAEAPELAGLVKEALGWGFAAPVLRNNRCSNPQATSCVISVSYKKAGTFSVDNGVATVNLGSSKLITRPEFLEVIEKPNGGLEIKVRP